MPGPVQASGSNADPLTRLTVTVKLHEAELFAPSVAVQVTVVTPTLKLLPEAGVQTGVLTLEHPSLTVGGFQVAIADAPVVPSERLAGQAIVGA